MLRVGLIFPMDKVELVSLIVISKKKYAIEIRVHVEYYSLNDTCVHYHFHIPFSDEVLDNVPGHGFFSYHQFKITEEDKNKTKFTKKWGSYSYHVMPFRLKNQPVVLSRIVVSAFRDYMHMFLEVYMDDWTVYSMVKKHSSFLRIMFSLCIQL